MKNFYLEDYNKALINAKKHLIFLFKAIEISKFTLTNEEKDNFLGSILICINDSTATYLLAVNDNKKGIKIIDKNIKSSKF